MAQEMPSKSFDRNMNHNYMILSSRDFFGNGQTASGDYRVRMLLENHIPGLLPVTHRMVDGESRYYYEINSLQSLDRLLERKEIGYEELKALLAGCICLFDRLEEYLLDGNQIIMKAEFIYIHVDRMEPYFVCWPDYKGDARASFMAFVDELLVRLDHADEHAVLLGYEVYRYTRNPNYVLGEIRRILERTAKEAAENTGTIMLPDTQTESRTHVKELYPDDPCLKYKDFDWREESSAAEAGEKPEKGKRTNLAGAVICLFIALSAAAVLLGARTLTISGLDPRQEALLYGASAMAAAAAVIFCVCFVKKEYRPKISGQWERCPLPEARRPRMDADYAEPEVFAGLPQRRASEEKSTAAVMPACNDTICLGSGAIEERVLRGRLNDREITVNLNRLPMTVGKLEGFADYVINDNTVSKMHARFEERDGRIYLCDLNSTNGTVKNGIMLDMNVPALLEPGDRIRFGRTNFIYC